MTTDNDKPQAPAPTAQDAVKKQPWPNHNWCVGCSPENCQGCGTEPLERRPSDADVRDAAEVRVPLTESEIAEAVRPMYADETAASMGLADDIRTARAIERILAPPSPACIVSEPVTDEGDTWRALCQFLLSTDDPMDFLRCWNEGNFEACRRDWPEAPEAVYPTGGPR